MYSQPIVAASSTPATTIREHRIGLLPGDGIGNDVVAAAVVVLNALEERFPFKTVRSTFSLGGKAYLDRGNAIDDDELARLAENECVLLGAIGDPRVPPGILERDLLLRLRRDFDLYVNLRPIRLRPGVISPIRGLRPDDCDMVVVRENTESLYCNAGGAVHVGSDHEIATQESLNTRHAVQRIVQFAFETAASRRGHVTLVHKANVLEYAGGLWNRTLNEVGASFPNVKTSYVHVDAACMFMITEPQRFDVIVTDNLFGDIISDIGAGVQGGIGLSASANLDPERRAPSIFEPIHGSAPDIAGQGIASPVGAIISLAMMLDFIGEVPAARAVNWAVDQHLLNLGDAKLSTDAVGSTIAELVGAVPPFVLEEV